MQTTNTTKQLIAVWNANHAYIEGERFDDMTLAAVNEFVSEYCDATIERVISDSAVLFLECVTAPETVTLETAPAPVETPAPVPPVSIDVMRGDRPWRLDPETLAARYGLRKTAQKCMVTSILTVAGLDASNVKDAERVLYRHIETGAPFAQCNGRFWALPDSAIIPDSSPVTVSHIAPEPKPAPAPKPAQTLEWATFEYEGNWFARRINRDKDGNETVTHAHETRPLADLAHVSRHYTKENAYKRVNRERKTAKKGARVTAKPETPRNPNGCKHIPESYNGAPVDVQAANLKTCDTSTAWKKVTAYTDEITAAGVTVACIVYERDFAWMYPVDRSEKYAKAHHAAVNFSSGRGHSLKQNRRAWFIDLRK